MRNFEREIRVLFDKQNRDAQRLIDFDDFLENCFHQNRRDAERWFVEHQTARFTHKRAADGQHLLFAA